MKRFAAFLLTLLLVFTLCSCGKKHVEEQTAPPAVEDQTGEQQPEVKPAPQPVKPEVKPDDTAEDETVTTAPVTPVVKPAEEVKPQGGTSGGGHHSGGTTVNDLTITEGKNVSGGTYKDVIIAESVGDGTVTLENVTIDGQLIIRGGGSNSVKVKNSKVKEVKLDKDTSTGGEAPRLELTGTEVKTVEVAKPAIIEAKDTASKVETLSAKDDVTIKGEETKVQNVTVPTEAKENVKLTVNDAAVEKVEVNKPVTIETKAAEGKTPVAAVEAKANVTVAGADTKVGTVTVPEAAKNNDVRLQVNNAKVAQVKAEAPVTIETNSAMGETPVEAVEAKANVTVTGAATNVGKVTVPEETKNAVKLTVTDAKVAEVSAEKPVTIEANENASKIEKVEALDTVTVQGDTQIDKVEAKAPVTVDGAKTKIETITVPAGVTTAPEIKVTKGSVNTVDAKSAASVSGGENAIANVEAAAPVEVDSAAVAKVTVTVNVTVTVSGDGQIEVAVDTDADVEIKAANTEKLSVSTTQNVATNITVKTGEETKEVHVHKWVESGRKEADCTTNGYIDYKCTTCSKTKRETIPAKGHVEVMIPAVEPTCTLPGSTAGKKCAVCEASIVAPRTIGALGHDFNGSLVSDETGHWHVCAYCGAVDTKQTHTYPTTSCTAAAKCTGCGYQKAAGVHTWDAGKVQKTATCETAGSMLYTCTSCGDTKTEAIPALGHVYGTPEYVWNGTSCTATRSCTRTGCSHKETETVTGTKTVLKLPTCEETGIESYSVAFKNSAFAPQTNQLTTKANGHQLSKVEAKPATCALVGNNAYWVCSECGKVFSDAEGKTATTVAAQMIALQSHNLTKTDAKDATCTEDGTKEYWTCSVCKKVFADENCTIETTVAARALKALGHTFDQKVAEARYLKSAATCTEKAVYYKSCSCGEKGTETFTSGEVLGHLYGEPTWTWTGYTSAKAAFACTRGGCTHTEEVTATGAAITNAVTTSAGCDSTGTRTYTATVTFGGKSYTDTKTETLAVLGHTGVKQNGQAATCEADGWKDYYECSVCHKLFSDSSCQNEIANLAVWKTGSGKLAALGHAYGNPAYEWNGDSCTATRVCANDATHKVTETKTGTYVKDTDATCTANEKGHYEVTFNDKQFGSASTAANSVEKAETALGHQWSTVWSKDATYHWHACTRQGCTAVNDKAAHNPGAAATEDTAQTCTVCGYELAPATGHLCKNHLTAHAAKAATCTQPGNNAYWSCTCGKYYSDAAATQQIAANSWVLSAIPHTYDQQVAEETYLKSAATCTAKAVYYKSCTCGAKGTETFEYGDVLGHSFTNYVSNGDATCTADGTKTAKCDRCDVTDTVADTDSKLGHSFTTKASAVKISDATCTAKAVYKVRCDSCDAVSDNVTVAVGELDPNNHTGTPGEWQTDSSTHWKVYSCCHAKVDEAAHSGGTATCKNKAVCAVCNAEYGELDQNNHSYGEASYVWNGTQCTATRVCANEGSHVETETVDGVYTVQKAATYTEDGSAVYKATFTNAAFTEQTSAAVTIPATPFKVAGEKYDTFEKALAAAKTAPEHIVDEFFGFGYDIYPTIEIYGSCTVEGNLHLATATSIAVKDGGSLTVTGNLIMEESTMNGFWLDAGTLRLEQGSSFKLGGVQYTGTNGAFAMDAMDNDESYIELAGRAPDMEGNDYVAVFKGNITQQGAFTMAGSYMFFNEQNSVLTVTDTLTNDAYVDNRGTILIDGGTLTNGGTIDNESGIIPNVASSINIKNNGTLTNEAGANITGGNIAAFGSTVNNAGTINNKKAIEVYGGTLTNSGEIVGVYEMNNIGFEDWSTYVSIEKGATLNNTGTIADLINVADYYTSTGKIGYTYNGEGGALGENARVEKVAAVFDVSKLQAVLNNGSYVNVIVSGTGAQNTVTLGNLTVPAGKLLILKETVNDGTNQYHNKFVLNGRITIEKDEQHPDGEDPHNGNLVTVGNPDVTVNGRIDAYGFIAFDTLTIADNGYVYVENERMIVDKALTIAEGGTLEIGSGSQMYYRGEKDATIKGTLIKTIRNENGFVKQVCSDIQGKSMTPNATMTTLVITQDTILHGEHEVDTVILANSEYEDKETGKTVTVIPTLRVGARGTLKFKDFYSIGDSTMEQIIGLTGTEGNYTVLPVDVKVTEVASATDFLAALDDPTVTDIAITEDITLTYADNLWSHPITKAVTVAKTATLEIKPYDPATDSGMEKPGGMKFNGLMIANNGSLTLEKGWLDLKHATLKTDTYRSGANEPWYEYRSQVNVNGGILDAEDGVLTTDSTGNIDFEVGNGELKLPSTVQNYLITYTVDSKEELLSANGANDPCNNILLKSDVVLTEDYTVNKVLTVMNDEEHMYRLTVGSGKTLTVPENVILYVNGELKVEGTLVNNGTIVGEGFIDVMGGTLNNGGVIDLNGESSDLAVEKGGKLRNFVGEYDESKTPGTITENTPIDFCDYWYDDAEPLCCHWDVLPEDHTLDGMGKNITVMAAAFSPDQVKAALATTTSWGEGDQQQTRHKYMVVTASGTEEENGTVELSNITVNPYQTLLLKDYVDVGDKTYHNAVYNLSNITFNEGAGMMIIGDPVVNVTGALDYSRIRVMGNPAINAPGFVHNKGELQAALPNGGDIYLLTLPEASKTDVYMDGQPDRESQYHIESEEPYTISTDTNLIGMTNESLAVFFDGGFTVAPNKTLRFDGLNVVAAANNSTVNGRVEICNGILVVQANSQNGATLTIEESGLVQIGNPDCDGRLAIFPKQDKDGEMFKNAEQIVNLGTIENYGDIINWNWNSETDHEPLEFANYADVVQDLYRDFGEMPNMDPLEDNDRENLVDVYPDSQEMYHEDGSDDEALDGFAWLIKNGIVPGYNKETNPELRPHHYVTRDEVQNLFNAFARKVLATNTDLVNIVADNNDARRLLCRTKNIGITEQDGNKRYISERDQCFDALRQALSSLQSTKVADKVAFMEALDNPLLTEIHVTSNITLNGYYYKDGHPVEVGTEDADGPAVYLEAAGRDHNEHREIIVESNASLTVAEDIKMDIRQNVKLRVDNGGKLIVNGNVNVFGELDPEENDESRITVAEGGSISYFGDACFFGEKLLEAAREYMDMENLNIREDDKKLDGWEDNNEKVKCLVAYGLEPQEDDNGHKWWDFGRTLNYGEMKTVLTNVYRVAKNNEEAVLPETVKAGDENGTPGDDDCLDNRSVKELLSRFALVLPKKEDATDSFTVAKDNDQTISGKIFTNPVTIACGTEPSGNDNFGGDIRFKNCEFKQGVEVQLKAGVNYNIRLENCTGSFMATATDMGAGGNVSFFGSNLTVNGLNITNMPDCESDDGGINVRYDECGNNGGVKSYIPTVEVVNNRDNTVFIRGNYSGKLRVAGKLNISGVSMAEPGFIELSNWHNGNEGAPESSITMNGQRIEIGEDGGNHAFTGIGTIHVNSEMRDLHLTVNERNLANPHVFGNVPNCAVFLGLADVDDVSFSLKQGTWDEGNRCVSSWTNIPRGNFAAVCYDESGKVTEGNPAPIKTHLERVEGDSGWITDPRHVNLTVTIANGCTVVYDKLWYKDAQVVDQGQTG